VQKVARKKSVKTEKKVKKSKITSPLPKPAEINPLNDVLPHHIFNCLDGRQVKNMYELADALETMSEDVYGHHVNLENNDFSNWLKHCTDEKQLSKERQPCIHP